MKLDINKECLEDKAYSDALKNGDSCNQCEFNIEVDYNLIDINGNVGGRRLCEKGYWKEDI